MVGFVGFWWFVLWFNLVVMDGGLFYMFVVNWLLPFLSLLFRCDLVWFLGVTA